MKLLTLLFSSFCMVQSSFSAPPKILVILVDDMGYGDLRCCSARSPRCPFA